MRRIAAAVLSGLLLALGLSACNPGPVDVTGDCSDQGARPPSEPGSAEVELTVASAPGTRQLTAVLYADGWVLTLAGESPTVNALSAPLMAPPPPAGRPWRSADVGSCQLQAIADLAAEELTEDADLGDVPITDQASTFVTYYGADTPTTTRAYALGDDGRDLSRADKHGRAVLSGLIAAQGEATRTGDVLPVGAVQVFGDADGEEPVGWPGPPLADLLVVDEYCGELIGEQARTVLDYLTSTDEEVGRLRAEVMPPGLPSCTGR